MTPNAALHSAIFEAGETQRAISIKARVPESRLSAIIRGRGKPATAQERRRLATVLRRSEDELFPTTEAA